MKHVGRNIFLRYPELIDSQVLLEWENDPNVWEYGDNKIPYTRNEMNQFIEAGQDFYLQKQLRFMICSNETQKAIGCIDLFDYHTENNEAGVGVLVYDHSNRKRGYANEALQLIILFAKNTLKLNHLFCHVMRDNKASFRLFEKNGFVSTFPASEAMKNSFGKVLMKLSLL